MKGEAFGTWDTMGVDVVCLSFSVELFIKNLYHVLTNEAPRGHRISKLFDSLPDDVKKDIFTYPSIAK
ncbi:hypothetical protein BTO01_28605 [Vibrio jasicida]|nr:hypothetical protein BTO01_28605 [Vibrio jasicida]